MATGPPDQTATMSDGSEFLFFDTGEPANQDSYETYLLFHGLCFNKRTWWDMVDKKDSSVRMVAFTLRGYAGCSDFNEAPTDNIIGPTLGNDFINMVTYVVNTLDVLANADSILTVIAWSLAAASVVAAYGSLIQSGVVVPQVWTSYISNLMFYEPAGVRAFGLPYWPASPATSSLISSTSSTSSAPSSSSTDPTAAFQRLAASYYVYDQAFYDRPCPSGVHDSADTVYISSCLIDTNPALWATCTDNIFESAPYGRYSRLTYNATPPGGNEPANRKAWAASALTAMANTEVKKIHGISTRQTLTGCTIGVKYLEALIQAVQPNKWYLTWIDGQYNHFVHNLNPQGFWDAVNDPKPNANHRRV